MGKLNSLRKAIANEPKKPEKKIDLQGKSSLAIHIGLAWESWGRVMVIPVVVLIIALIAYFEISNETVLGVLASSAVILIVGWTLLHAAWPIEKKGIWPVLAALFIIVLMVAALYPIIEPVVFEPPAEKMAFAKADDSLPIPVHPGGERWWLMEVHGKLVPTDFAYDADYLLKLETGDDHQMIKGRLKKTWKKVRTGRRTRGKKLANHDRNIHRVTADLSKPSTLTLRKLDGKLEGPLEVFLRPEPVMWNYMLAIHLPLLLIAAILDILEGEKSKRQTRWTVHGAFLLIFGTVFADNWVPGIWFGPLAFGVVAATIGSLVAGWLLPRLLYPLVVRIANR